jgi:hypothetical protein
MELRAKYTLDLFTPKGRRKHDIREFGGFRHEGILNNDKEIRIAQQLPYSWQIGQEGLGTE